MLYLLTGLILFVAIVALIGYFKNHKPQHHSGTVNPPASGKQITNAPDKNNPETPSAPAASGCCGQHDVCALDIMPTTATRKTIEYYDDEELDQYIGIAPDRYDEKAVEAFCEVLYTLQANEVAGWLYSLQLRNVLLPDQLRDEAALIIEEQRYNR